MANGHGVKDARFARVQSDPRFRRAKRDDTKVVLDDRFKDVLQPTKGKKLDRFGRRQAEGEAEELRRLYRLDGGDAARGEVELESSSDEEDEEEEEEEEEDDDDDDESEEDEPVVIGRQDAVRRAQAYDSDDSIDLEEDDFDPEVVAELDKQASGSKGSKKREVVARGDDTCRLAVVNMDWDHIHARDLYKVFASLVHPEATRLPHEPLPASGKNGFQSLTAVRGQVKSVRVYVSDFGRERLAKEDIEGPPRAIFKEAKDSDEDEPLYQVDEGSEFDEQALRKYQLERLRYYYAVATFDSKESARFVYNEIDGTEMERSANLFDLRFVPDDMELPDGEDGRECGWRDEATDDKGHYEGLDFKTDALRHSRVRLTWDQDDPRRMKVTHAAARNQKDVHEDDMKTYLASDSEEEEEDTAQSRDRLRSLLAAPKANAFDDADDEESMYAPKSRDGDMQITFVPALAPGAKPAKPSEDETTIEKYMRKQKEKRERKKAQREEKEKGEEEAEEEEEAGAGEDLGFDDPFFASDPGDFEQALAQEQGNKKDKKDKKDKKSKKVREPSPPADADGHDSDADQHFSLQDIVRAEKLQNKKLSKQQKKREARREAKRTPLTQPSFAMDTQDPRFAAVKEDYRFAIDPNHPGFVKTEGMQKLLEEGRKQHPQSQDAPPPSAPDLQSLVSSVKRNAPQVNRRAKKQRS